MSPTGIGALLAFSESLRGESHTQSLALLGDLLVLHRQNASSNEYPADNPHPPHRSPDTIYPELRHSVSTVECRV